MSEIQYYPQSIKLDGIKDLPVNDGTTGRFDLIGPIDMGGSVAVLKTIYVLDRDILIPVDKVKLMMKEYEQVKYLKYVFSYHTPVRRISFPYWKLVSWCSFEEVPSDIEIIVNLNNTK